MSSLAQFMSKVLYKKRVNTTIYINVSIRLHRAWFDNSMILDSLDVTSARRSWGCPGIVTFFFITPYILNLNRILEFGRVCSSNKKNALQSLHWRFRTKYDVLESTVKYDDLI